MTSPTARLSPTAPAAAGLAAAAAAAAVLVLAGARYLPAADQDRSPQVAVDYAQRGECFLHGLPGDPDLHMNLPMSTVWAAAVFQHREVPARPYKLVALACLAALLAAASLLLAPSSPWVPAAACLVLASCLTPDFLLYPQTEYAFLVLMVAGLLLWRAARPGLARTLLLACGIGSTLLFRSPLAFFPPLLVLAEWIGSRRRDSPMRPYGRHAFVLLSVPYLFLAPWAWMNWERRHQVVLLEGGQADTNIVSGALGLVETVEGDWTLLVDPAVNINKPGAVLSWAAREAARHPLRYAHAYLLRLGLCARQHPIALALALLGWWLRRRSPGRRGLALLAVFFVGIHCFMSVDVRYLAPVWPLLALLGASVLEGRSPSGRGFFSPGGLAPRAGARLVGAALAGTLALASFTAAKAAAMARAQDPPWSEGRWAAELGRWPAHAWLFAQRAEQRLKGGDLAGAAGDLSRAAALQPSRVDYVLRLAWLRSATGRLDPALDRPLPPEVVDYRVKLAYRFYRAEALLRGGARDAAVGELKAARDVFDATILVHGGAGERERRLQAELRSRDERFADVALGFTTGMPERGRLALCRELAGLDPAAAGECVELADRAAGRGDRALAADAVRGLETLSLRPAERHRLALLCQRLGDHRRAVRHLAALARENPREAVFLSDLGVNEFLAGSVDAAVRDLKAAVERDPGLLAAPMSLGAIYARQGRKREAREVYDRALAVPSPKDAALRGDIERAREALGP